MKYRTLSKPNISFQIMITNVLKTEAARNGLTINEITEAIKEVYPYYKYCTDGWQFSINHCIKFTKIYKRLQKEVQNGYMPWMNFI